MTYRQPIRATSITRIGIEERHSTRLCDTCGRPIDTRWGNTTCADCKAVSRPMSDAAFRKMRAADLAELRRAS